MKRVLLVVAYDGTQYCGWQVQPHQATIEGELNKALESLTGVPTEVIGASRTDSGVHAKCNLAVFDTESPIPGEKFFYAVNKYLPADIRVIASREVPTDFHPRHMETKKTYEYRIQCAAVPDPMRRNYVCFTFRNMDVAAMQEGAAKLIGEHDFASFCSAGSTAETTVRTLYQCDVRTHGDEIIIRVQGSGFLYNMVRIIAGTLMDVGVGLRSPEDVQRMLDAADRSAAGPTAPPQGLTLVNYEIVSTGEIFGK
ncbi:MAG: tRNA pseudouridine(38-40) synthase TruA [Lachnospiraceae bacterium]|nr:tRNA pseudouridine(38-40) synthase TruA [Lachnospiraceae bacterium]